MTRPIEIAPSVLPADFSKLGDEVAALEAAGVDRIQWDVMDGQFVPNLTFGPDVIKSTRRHTTLPFEAHLMVLTPDADGGRLRRRRLQPAHRPRRGRAPTCTARSATSRSLGATAAVALNPSTPASRCSHVLDLVDMVLVMTVNPGFGGQSLHRHDGAEDPPRSGR